MDGKSVAEKGRDCHGGGGTHHDRRSVQPAGWRVPELAQVAPTVIGLHELMLAVIAELRDVGRQSLALGHQFADIVCTVVRDQLRHLETLAGHGDIGEHAAQRVVDSVVV